jgi:chitin disaccharide deacetylase
VCADRTNGLNVTTAGAAACRHIWLCADDFGISNSVNIAIRDLVVRERLNATSVLVVAPSFSRSEAISLNALNSVTPRVAIGLHLGLTAPFRPLSKSFSPVNEGSFLSLIATARHAAMRRFDHAALVAEITLQMQTFRSTFGRAPDFVDGHQHVHLLPQISDALLSVVKESGLDTWVRQCGRVIPMAARLADRKGLVLDIMSYRFRRRAAALGLRTNPGFAGTYQFDDAADFPVLFPRFLDGLPDGSVVMCHPGFVDAELQRLDPLTTLREKEYAYFAGDSFPAALTSHDVALAGAASMPLSC